MAGVGVSALVNLILIGDKISQLIGGAGRPCGIVALGLAGLGGGHRIRGSHGLRGLYGIGGSLSGLLRIGRRRGGGLGGNGGVAALAVNHLLAELGHRGEDPLGHGDADDVGNIGGPAGNVNGKGVGSALLQGLRSVNAGQIDHGIAVLVGDAARLGAGGEGRAALGLDVQLGIHDGFLEGLRVLQRGIGLIHGFLVGQGQGIGRSGSGDLQLRLGSAGDDLLRGQSLVAVQRGLHGADDLVLRIQGGHPGDQAAQALLSDISALGHGGPDVIAGEEVAGGLAVVIAGLGRLVVILLQIVLGDQAGQVGLAEGAAVHAVVRLDAVGGSGGVQAGVLGIAAVILDAAPAAGIGGNADHDLGIVDLIAVGILQILHTGIHGEGALGLGRAVICGVRIQSGLMGGVAVPRAVQVVGHHVGEVNDVHDLVILDLCHKGGVRGHGAGQLVVLAVLLAQVVQLVPDGLHHQREVPGVGLGAFAALVDGHAVAGGIGVTVRGGILPVDVYKVEAQVVHKLCNVLGEVGSGRGAGGQLGEVAGAGPAAHGNTDLHVGIFIPEDHHRAQDAGIGLAVGDAVLLGQDRLEIGVLVAEDQVAVGIHIHERKVQVRDLAAVNLAGVEIFLSCVDGPVTIIHHVTVTRRCGAVRAGADAAGICACGQNGTRQEDEDQEHGHDFRENGSSFHGDTPFQN